jgi:hypothetical protein
MVAVELVARVWFDLGQWFMVEVRTVAQLRLNFLQLVHDWRRTSSLWCKLSTERVLQYGNGKEEIQRGWGHKDKKGQEREEFGRGRGKKSEGE